MTIGQLHREVHDCFLREESQLIQVDPCIDEITYSRNEKEKWKKSPSDVRELKREYIKYIVKITTEDTDLPHHTTVVIPFQNSVHIAQFGIQAQISLVPNLQQYPSQF